MSPQKVVIDETILQKFLPNIWEDLSVTERKNVVETLIEETEKQLGIQNKYEIRFETQRDGIAAEFVDNVEHPYISLEKDYFLYGTKTNANEENKKIEEAKEYLGHPLRGTKYTTLLFNNCLHETEHIRQYEIEKDIIKQNPLNDTDKIKYNNTSNVVKIGLFKKNGTTFLSPEINSLGIAENSTTNFLHKSQYVERTAYMFAEYNTNQLLEYFQNNGLYTYMAEDSIKEMFPQEKIKERLIEKFGCNENELFDAIDECIKSLTTKEIPNAPTKLWKRIKDLSIKSYTATYLTKNVLNVSNENKDEKQNTVISSNINSVFTTNEIQQVVNDCICAMDDITNNEYKEKSQLTNEGLDSQLDENQNLDEEEIEI